MMGGHQEVFRHMGLEKDSLPKIQYVTPSLRKLTFVPTEKRSKLPQLQFQNDNALAHANRSMLIVICSMAHTTCAQMPRRSASRVPTEASEAKKPVLAP